MRVNKKSVTRQFARLVGAGSGNPDAVCGSAGDRSAGPDGRRLPARARVNSPFRQICLNGGFVFPCARGSTDRCAWGAKGQEFKSPRPDFSCALHVYSFQPGHEPLFHWLNSKNKAIAHVGLYDSIICLQLHPDTIFFLFRCTCSSTGQSI